jgi:glycerophosphoryl diester phosphodiesterase
MSFDWLIRAPYAHRGVHGPSLGLVENTLAAAEEAIRRKIGIECDVRLSGDGIPVVFHDEALLRLTGQAGFVHEQEAQALERLVLTGTDCTIAPLSRFLERVAGQVPLLVEIKTRAGEDIASLAKAIFIGGATVFRPCCAQIFRSCSH